MPTTTMEVLVHVLACCLSPPLTHGGAVVVDTQLGKVRGLQTSRNQIYRGVPYAQPPVGEQRWRPPLPVSPWQPGTLDASGDVTIGCPQVHCDVFMSDFDCPRQTSEDCLKMNIYTPAAANNSSLLPVMFFIHGGSYIWCSGTAPLFDGSVLAERGDVIVVTFNYRLGVMGFLVTGTSKLTDATGNYGLQDQRLALQWVNQHIRSFGGDPRKVTVFGQSCGAQSVFNHMASKESSKYFRSGIVQSPAVGVALRSFEEQFNVSKLFAKKLGCPVSDLKCMKNYSAQEVVEAAFSCAFDISTLNGDQISSFHGLHPFGPYVDGEEVKGQFVDVMTSGDFTPKPLIVGTTRDENMKEVELVFKKHMSLPLYLWALGSLSRTRWIELVMTYPPHGITADHSEAFATADADHMFTCPSRNISFAVVGQGRRKVRQYDEDKARPDVWLYVWDRSIRLPGWLEDCPDHKACHEAELPYVFAAAYKKNVSFPYEDQQLSDLVIDYWTNFAWSGDPNIPRPTAVSGQRKLLHWPRIQSRSEYHAFFFQVPGSHVIKNYRRPECDFWDSIGYYPKQVNQHGID